MTKLQCDLIECQKPIFFPPCTSVPTIIKFVSSFHSYFLRCILFRVHSYNLQYDPYIIKRDVSMRNFLFNVEISHGKLALHIKCIYTLHGEEITWFAVVEHRESERKQVEEKIEKCLFLFRKHWTGHWHTVFGVEYFRLSLSLTLYLRLFLSLLCHT